MNEDTENKSNVIPFPSTTRPSNDPVFGVVFVSVGGKENDSGYKFSSSNKALAFAQAASAAHYIATGRIPEWHTYMMDESVE